MRTFTITVTEPGHEVWDEDKVTRYMVDADCLKTLTNAVVLLVWHPLSMSWIEVASFTCGDGVSVVATSVTK